MRNLLTLGVDKHDHVLSYTPGSPDHDTQLSPEAFLEASLPPDVAEVGVVGGKASLRLLAGLVRREPPLQLWSCSPLAGSLPSEAHHCALSPSVGGWVRLDEHECEAIRHAEVYLDVSRGQAGIADLEASLFRHPAWPGLSFASGLDLTSVAVLLAELVDPRWYIDPEKPNKLSRLECFLGLLPKVQLAVSRRHPPDRRWRFDLCHLVMSCWNGQRPSRDEINHPGWFLQRERLKRNPGDYRADMKTSRAFVRFLHSVWLQALYPRVEMFVPSYFFRTSGEVAAFALHAGTAARAG